MSEITATRMRTWNARTAAGAATLLAAAAGWSVAGYFLWTDSVVPDGLRLPDVDPGRVFGERVVERASDFAAFEHWMWVAKQVTLLATFALYARFGARFARESAAGRIGTGMLLGMLGFAILWLVQLPFRIAEHWWATRYDLADDSVADYLAFIFGDWFSLGVSFVFLCATLMIVMGLAGWLGRWWWIVGGPVFVGVAALYLFVAP
jgi:hypothetical protein